MQSYTFSVCRQCRQALARQFHSSLPAGRSAKRVSPARKVSAGDVFRVSSSAGLPPALRARHPLPSNHKDSAPHRPRLNPSAPRDSLKGLGPESVRRMVLEHLPTWINARQTTERLTTLGLTKEEVDKLLDSYAPHIQREIESEVLEGRDPWSIGHLIGRELPHKHAIADRVLTMRLFPFAVKSGLAISGISDMSMHVLRQANVAFELRYPAEVFSLARRLHRKIILHVGPTNSGKTYNALRALAAARSGVYAGPLRLLAHEVWERLNRGSIRPHDADPAEAHRYARQCNLVTGEEQRIVAERAPLTSCTVEMMNLNTQYEVCVIDEIQMIADPERGHAWTSAVLGVCAQELHLCGEETAVPLITELVKETRDDLEIKYYERLTPLAVADKSLEGRWDKIQKGDCLVTFSRAGIFSLKRTVEEATGLRCAVAYGRLPPETRSEQAALFNAPDSGYDIMVASDAIGMGLNLKIKRIVFVQVNKFDGIRNTDLSLSQIKQIGGRAGRFGDHGDASSGGIVTCLRQNDLPVLTRAFQSTTPNLHQAVLPLHNNMLERVAEFLPESFGLKALHEVILVAARIGKNYCMPEIAQKLKPMDIIDHYGSGLQLHERVQFSMAPTSWRMDAELEVVVQYLQQFVRGEAVNLRDALRHSALLETLEMVSNSRLEHETNSTEEGAATGYSVQSSSTLARLETLHKVLITYAWLSFRIPASFNQKQEAVTLKLETEKGIEFVLEGIANVTQKKKGKTMSMRQIRAEPGNSKINYVAETRRVPRVLRRAGIVAE